MRNYDIKPSRFMKVIQVNHEVCKNKTNLSLLYCVEGCVVEENDLLANSKKGKVQVLLRIHSYDIRERLLQENGKKKVKSHKVKIRVKEDADYFY